MYSLYAEYRSKEMMNYLYYWTSTRAYYCCFKVDLSLSDFPSMPIMNKTSDLLLEWSELKEGELGDQSTKCADYCLFI